MVPSVAGLESSEYVFEFWARGVVECGETFVVGDVGGGDVEGRDGLGMSAVYLVDRCDMWVLVW